MPKKRNYFVAIYATNIKLLKEQLEKVDSDIIVMLVKNGLLGLRKLSLEKSPFSSTISKESPIAN